MSRQIPLINSDKMTTVDDEDYDWLMEYEWRLVKSGNKEYAATGYPPVFMQNLIMLRVVAESN